MPLFSETKASSPVLSPSLISTIEYKSYDIQQAAFQTFHKTEPSLLFSPKCKGLCYCNSFLQTSTSYIIFLNNT